MSHVVQKGEIGVFLAVIGDIKRSRRDPDRAATQHRLEAALAAVNDAGGDDLASRFVVTVGDEFQGLLRRPGAGMGILARIEDELGDTPLRFGLGWGVLSTALQPQALGMDGPCFHNARAALEQAKRGDRRTVVCGFGDEPDRAVNGVLQLMNGVRERWKPAQRETVRLMRASELQKDVAELRNVSNSVVSETLKSALYRQVMDAEESIRFFMDHFAAGEAAGREPR